MFRAYVTAVTGRPSVLAGSVQSMDPTPAPVTPPLSLFVVRAVLVALEPAADRTEAAGLSAVRAITVGNL